MPIADAERQAGQDRAGEDRRSTVLRLLIAVQADRAGGLRRSRGRGFWMRFARSIAEAMAPEAMDPEVARSQNDDDHGANNSKDVHSALLPVHDDAHGLFTRLPYPPLSSQ